MSNLDRDPLADFTCDHLFLLIGANPLPNYMAARLVAGPNATVYLLHTSLRDGPTTIDVARRVETLLAQKRPDIHVSLREIAAGDGARITNAIKAICRTIPLRKPPLRIGLNYTGGTKPMAVHTYRAIADMFPAAAFSYLDTRGLALHIERPGPAAGLTYYIFKDTGLRRRLELNLAELAGLHGYKLCSESRQTHDAALLQALAAIHASKPSYDQWKQWLNTPPPWQLPTLECYPLLGRAIEAFTAIAAGSSQPPELAVAQSICSKYASLDSCRKWFNGGWLEEYILLALLNLAAHDSTIRCAAGQCKFALNLDTHLSKGLELDAAVMLGHRLYAISAIASDKSDGESKKHLFEAYVRARQLGGDEARTALVCCVDNPRLLLDEVTRAWDAEDKLQVFGRADLSDLEHKLQLWFNQSTM